MTGESALSPGALAAETARANVITFTAVFRSNCRVLAVETVGLTVFRACPATRVR
jgi:hypothetical protein